MNDCLPECGGDSCFCWDRVQNGICYRMLDLPVIPAGLTGAITDGLVLDLLLLVFAEGADKSRESQKDPFEYPPDPDPPAAKQPPENAMVSVFQSLLIDELYIHIVATAFRTLHNITSLLF